MSDKSEMKKVVDDMLKNSIELKNQCRNLHTDVEMILTKTNESSPSEKKSKYDKTFDVIEKNINDTNGVITYLLTIQNEINKNITDSIDCYKELREEIEKIGLSYNVAKIGNLEDLSHDAVKKYNVPSTGIFTNSVLNMYKKRLESRRSGSKNSGGKSKKNKQKLK